MALVILWAARWSPRCNRAITSFLEACAAGLLNGKQKSKVMLYLVSRATTDISTMPPMRIRSAISSCIGHGVWILTNWR